MTKTLFKVLMEKIARKKTPGCAHMFPTPARDVSGTKKRTSTYSTYVFFYTNCTNIEFFLYNAVQSIQRARNILELYKYF
jgi:hypothetical protein